MASGNISQIALCTDDAPLSTRVLCDGLGFAQAGGRALWGPNIGRIQGLPTAAETTAVVSWVVGRQDFVQIELFNHTNPPQRPVDPRRLPSDLGWSRWGVATDAFDASINRLHRLGVGLLGAPRSIEGS